MVRSAVTASVGLRQLAGEFVRFSLVGVASFALDVGGLVALRTATPLPLAVDTAAAFAVAALFNFTLGRQWVFPNAARGGRPQADLARYAVLTVAGLALTTATVPLLAVAGLDYRLAKLAASLMVALLNFIVMPRWVFQGGSRIPGSVSSSVAP